MNVLKKEKESKQTKDVEKSKNQDPKEVIDHMTEDSTGDEENVTIKLLISKVSKMVLREILEKAVYDENELDLEATLERMIKDSSVTEQLRTMTRRNDIDPDKKRLSATLLREIEDIRAKKS
jgi:hypothetical protein